MHKPLTSERFRLQLESERNPLSIVLLGVAHSLNHSLFVIAPSLLTLIMASLNVSKSGIGLVSMVASFIYGAGALFSGLLSDKIREAKTIAASLAFSGFSTFIMLVAWAMGSIYVYALALTLMAAWASLYHPAANSLIYKTFTERVAENMGWHGAGGTIGVVLTPTIAWFLGATFGWSWAFVTFGVLCILLASFFPRCFGKTSRGQVNGGTIIGALRIRKLWILLIFGMMIGLFMRGVELYFPIYLIENRLIDPAWASIAYTLVLAVGIPAQWIGGMVADKIGSKKVLIASSAGVCIGLLSLLLLPIYIVGIALFILFYGLFFYAHQPAITALTGFLSPPNQRGAVYSIYFFMHFGISSLSQFIVGYLADLYGLDVAFYLLTAFALAALPLSFKLPK